MLMEDSCACVSGAAYTQLGETRVGKKDPVQILGICALITDCCFWSQRCRWTGWWPLLHLPHCCKTLPLQLKWLPGALKGWQPSSLFTFFFFLFWEPDIQKQMHIWGNQKVTMHAQGKYQKWSEKTLSLYLRLILSTETAYNNKQQQ